MSAVRTLLWNGTDLRAMPLRVLRLPLRAPGNRKGSDDDIPGLQGLLPAEGLELAAYSFSALVQIKGATSEEFDANLDSILEQLSGTAVDGLGTLTRRLPRVGGSGHEDQTAQGRFVAAASYQTLNYRLAQTELQFVNLDGAWLDTGNMWRL